MEKQEALPEGKEPEMKKSKMEEVEEEALKKDPSRKCSKTWEAMKRLKGSLIVNDPKFLL